MAIKRLHFSSEVLSYTYNIILKYLLKLFVSAKQEILVSSKTLITVVKLAIVLQFEQHSLREAWLSAAQIVAICHLCDWKTYISMNILIPSLSTIRGLVIEVFIPNCYTDGTSQLLIVLHVIRFTTCSLSIWIQALSKYDALLCYYNSLWPWVLDPLCRSTLQNSSASCRSRLDTMSWLRTL